MPRRTDHVFVDGGHTIDFTNKAFEVLDHLGWDHAARSCCPTLTDQTARGVRAEEAGAWRHPHDLAGLLRRRRQRPAGTRLATAGAGAPFAARRRRRRPGLGHPGRRPGRDRGRPRSSRRRPVPPPRSSAGRWPTPPPCGSRASTPRTTTATGTSSTTPSPRPTPSTSSWSGRHARTAPRGLPGRPQGLPRPLPQCARPRPYRAVARRQRSRPTWLALQACWDPAGHGRRGRRHRLRLARGWRFDGHRSLAALGAALLHEDAEFHWFQMYEAAVRQSRPGPKVRSRLPSSWPARPASWPPTPPPAASCPKWCASPPGCAGASRSTRSIWTDPLPPRSTVEGGDDPAE